MRRKSRAGGGSKHGMSYRPIDSSVQAFRFTAEAEITGPTWFGDLCRAGRVKIDTVLEDGSSRVYGCTILTKGGYIKAKKGEYLILDQSGRITAATPEEFKQLYAEEAS